MATRKKTQVVETVPRVTRRSRKTNSSISLNEGLHGTVASRLKDAWKHCLHLALDGDPTVELYHEPFKHCIVRHFLNSNEAAMWIRYSAIQCEMFLLHNDRHRFSQSADLQKYGDDFILSEFMKFLNTECREWIQNITGIPLNNKVSATCSIYKLSDFLLCHEDLKGDRRIAFILFLSDNWLETYGGALQLYSSNDDGQPMEIVQTIFPEFNKFVFFEVTQKSFHQVQEILSSSQYRITVSGWFHGPSIQRIRPFAIPQEPLSLLPVYMEDYEVDAFMNDAYLVKHLLTSVIYFNFKFDCCIGMDKFLKGDWASIFLEYLKSDEVQWTEVGPANRRKYDVCSVQPMCADWQKFILLMRSHQMFSFIAKIAGLMGKVTDTQQVYFAVPKTEHTVNSRTRRSVDGSESEALPPRCRYEIQRWRSGYYALLQSQDFNREFSVLEAFLFLIVDPIDPGKQGGTISYICKEDENVLISIRPCHNSLIVAYKNKNVASFTTYLNSQFTGTLYVIKFTYGH